MARQYSLQVKIFIEKDDCIDRLRRKTATQVINDYASHRIVLQSRLREGRGRCWLQELSYRCLLLAAVSQQPPYRL